MIILFGVWFFSIQSALSPFILSLIIIGFLLPFRQNRSIRVLIALVFVLFMIWLFYYLQDIIAPFIISFALAYLFDPVVDKFQAKKISRSFSIVIIILFIIGSLVAFGLFVIPQFVTEVQSLGKTLPSYQEFKDNLRLNWTGFFSRIGIDLNYMIQMIESESKQKLTEFLKYFSAGAEGISSSLSSIMTQLINLILIPFATFYFLRDFDRNMNYLRGKIPDRHKGRAEKIYSRINTILSLYIRGKVLVAIIIAVITWILLLIFQINFALIIAMLAGFLSLIPYVGSILKFGIGLLLGLMNPDPLTSEIVILSVLLLVEILDMVIISPKVIGEKLGIHPVLMIFSMFVFAKVLGILGLLIAIPVTAILKVFVLEWYEQHFYNKEFLGEEKAIDKKEI
jgi:predicted PurR-regulated permease PerM